MRRLLCLALALAGCHSSANFDLALAWSPVLDEHPFAGVDTLELRWSRPGMARTVDHVPWKQQTRLSLTAPALADGAQLELAAISDGNVVAVGRTAPLPKGARSATAYVGLVDRFVAAPTERPLSSARFGASATRLGDGRVLIAGGATRGSPGLPDPSSISALVELYDPAAGTFTIFPAAGFVERVYHAAGATPDGGVLLAGGLGKFGPGDDLYKIDPQRAASIGKLPGPRWAAAAATLADGALFVVGGYTTSDGSGGGMLAADALVVTADGATTSIALPTPRAFAVATLLADGRVLVSGGVDAMGPRDDALLYSPATRSFAPLSPSAGTRAAMIAPRVGHSATLLPSGAVFLFGGNDGHQSIADAELWSADAGGFVDSPIFNVTPRQGHTGAALADGSVVLVGGESSPQRTAVPSPVLDPLRFRPAATGTSGVLGTDLGRAPARADATATALGDGSLLYVGGAVGDPRTLAAGAQLLVPCFDACLAVTP